jgi:3-methyladenine DNA glycosylase AlkD
MTVTEVLEKLEALGTERMRSHNKKFGAGDNQFGVKMGDIRALANKIKTDHKLGLALWETGNIDARFLAALIIKPKELSVEELNRLVSRTGLHILPTGYHPML